MVSTGQIIFYAILILFALYVVITSIKYIVLNQHNEFIYRKVISKYEIPDEIDLGKYGIIKTATNIYKYENLKQIPIHHDLINIKEIAIHFYKIVRANVYNTGPFYGIFLTGIIYPLRQILDVQRYFYYDNEPNQTEDYPYKVIIQNKGKDIQISVIKKHYEIYKPI